MGNHPAKDARETVPSNGNREQQHDTSRDEDQMDGVMTATSKKNTTTISKIKGEGDDSEHNMGKRDIDNNDDDDDDDGEDDDDNNKISFQPSEELINEILEIFSHPSLHTKKKKNNNVDDWKEIETLHADISKKERMIETEAETETTMAIATTNEHNQTDDDTTDNFGSSTKRTTSTMDNNSILPSFSECLVKLFPNAKKLEIRCDRNAIDVQLLSKILVNNIYDTEEKSSSSSSTQNTNLLQRLESIRIHGTFTEPVPAEIFRGHGRLKNFGIQARNAGIYLPWKELCQFSGPTLDWLSVWGLGHSGLEDVIAQLGNDNDCLLNLVKLRRLNLFKATTLEYFPKEIGNLSESLRILSIGSFRNLRCLPTTIGQLTHLETLKLIDCGRLQCLPTSMGDLSNLQELTLSSCTSVREIPEELGNCPKLVYLDMSGSSQCRIPNTLFARLCHTLKDVMLEPQSLLRDEISFLKQTTTYFQGKAQQDESLQSVSTTRSSTSSFSTSASSSPTTHVVVSFPCAIPDIFCLSNLRELKIRSYRQNNYDDNNNNDAFFVSTSPSMLANYLAYGLSMIPSTETARKDDDNKKSDDGSVSTLTSSLHHSLRCLSLSCHFTEEHVSQFWKSLSECKNLTTLDLTGNMIRNWDFMSLRRDKKQQQQPPPRRRRRRKEFQRNITISDTKDVVVDDDDDRDDNDNDNDNDNDCRQFYVGPTSLVECELYRNPVTKLGQQTTSDDLHAILGLIRSNPALVTLGQPSRRRRGQADRSLHYESNEVDYYLALNRYRVEYFIQASSSCNNSDTRKKHKKNNNDDVNYSSSSNNNKDYPTQGQEMVPTTPADTTTTTRTTLSSSVTAGVGKYHHTVPVAAVPLSLWPQIIHRIDVGSMRGQDQDQYHESRDDDNRFGYGGFAYHIFPRHTTSNHNNNNNDDGNEHDDDDDDDDLVEVHAITNPKTVCSIIYFLLQGPVFASRTEF